MSASGEGADAGHKTLGSAGNGGLTFTELGFGAAPLGNLFRALTDDEAHAVLEAAWAAGVRYFDTAPLYGLGLSETRLNRFLRGKPRDEYVLSSKVGRLLQAVPPGPGRRGGQMGRRALAQGDLRLQLRRRDAAAWSSRWNGWGSTGSTSSMRTIWTSSTTARKRRCKRGWMPSWRAATARWCALRDQGVIRAFGGGMNEWQPCQWLLERGDFDIFLLAGPLHAAGAGGAGELPAPVRGARVSGSWWVGPTTRASLPPGRGRGRITTMPRRPTGCWTKAARLQAVCAAHGVRLVDAAFQFPLRHPAVVSVIPGGQGLGEMASNLAAAKAVMPQALWDELKAEELVHADAPV